MRNCFLTTIPRTTPVVREKVLNETRGCARFTRLTPGYSPSRLRRGKNWPIRSVQAKRKEDISGPRCDAAVAGVHEDHAAGNDQRRTVDAGAGRFDAIHCREFLVRIELPENRSIGRGVGAKPAVVRTRDHSAGNQCDRSSLRRTATLLSGAQPRIRTGHAPDLLSGCELHRADAAGILALTVADTEVDVLAVGRCSPLTAKTAALTEPVFPHEIAGIRIERVRDSGLLRDDENLPVTDCCEQRRG